MNRRTWLAAIAGSSAPLPRARQAPRPTPRHAPTYPDHTRLLVVRNANGRESPVLTPAEWEVRRAHILAHFQDVAGPLPGGERRVPLNTTILEQTQLNHGRRLKLAFQTEPGDTLHAWLHLPELPTGPRPGLLCLHQTTPIGKGEPAGIGGLPNLHYARELAARGYVTLAPDYPGFGESQVDPYALDYQSATMKGIWNHLRAVDLLAGRPEVDPTRIGAIGHSLGGHNAVFLACFDPRVRAVVSSCGFNAFPRYFEGNIAGWSHKGYMPRLRSVYKLDLTRVPFDFPELLAVLAPRPVFINAPVRDDNFAVDGVRICVDAARPVFELLHAPDHLAVVHPDAPHDFPPDTRRQAYRFLDQHLKG